MDSILFCCLPHGFHAAPEEIRRHDQRADEIQPRGFRRVGRHGYGHQRNGHAGVHQALGPVEPGLHGQDGVGICTVQPGVFMPEDGVGDHAQHGDGQPGNHVALVAGAAHEGQRDHKRAAQAHHRAHKQVRQALKAKFARFVALAVLGGHSIDHEGHDDGHKLR